MKKIIILLAFSVMMILSINMNVFAGEYDENEQYVISQLSAESFPSEMKQQYINQLQNYFLQDDVSLSKDTAQDFIHYLREGMIEKKSSAKKKKTLKQFSKTYQNFQKAGDILGLYIEYDSFINDFYAIDELGHIVIDSQPVIKNTDTDKEKNQSWNISIEAVFAVVVCLCILGILANVRRWNKKIRIRHNKRYEEEEEDDEMEVANRKTRKARLQTFSYRSVKQLLRYFYVPIVMGLIVVAVGALIKTQYKDIIDSVDANFINTQPLYREGEGKEKVFVKSTESSAETVELSKITWPKYGEQYGVLKCKKLDINTPVYFGDRGTLLEKGAGSYIGSMLPGMKQTILIGAHDTTYFAGLEKVHQGDRFTFTTEYGIYKYEVKDMKIVKQDQFESAYNLGAKKEQLILYTCYPFGRLNGTKEERMFVYLDKVSGPDIRY